MPESEVGMGKGWLIREKWLREESCPVCAGKGAVPVGLGTFGRLRPTGWEACPECDGAGVVFPAYEDPHLEAYDLRPRPPFVEEELRKWVRVYREARQEAGLPPEKAKEVADLTVYGPLPF
jgi:hypothetical protein